MKPCDKEGRDDTNFLEETLGCLGKCKKTPKDVRWVGSRDGKYVINWAEFEVLADTCYDNGFGSQEVADDLVVVGNGWWLERSEYDGAEGWRFKKTPRRRKVMMIYDTITVEQHNKKYDDIAVGWQSLSSLNRPDVYGDD